MKVELTITQDLNGMEEHLVNIDEKKVALIRDLSECPEDAHIGRDLVDGHDIIKFIKLGYDAGKNGKILDIIYSE